MPAAARGCGFAGCNSLMSLFPSHGGAYQQLSHVPIEPWWETNPATTPRQELGMVSPELRREGINPPCLGRRGVTYGESVRQRPERSNASHVELRSWGLLEIKDSFRQHPIVEEETQMYFLIELEKCRGHH